MTPPVSNYKLLYMLNLFSLALCSIFFSPISQANDTPAVIPEILPYDPELDLGTSPPPDDLMGESGLAESTQEDQWQKKIWAEETLLFETETHWLSTEVGMFLNYNSSLGYQYYFGVGAKYGLTLFKRFVMSSNDAQDSVSVDVGVFNYRVVSYEKDNDSYTVLPIIADVRYNVYTSDSFLIFGYVGFIYNNILTSNNETSNGMANLGSSGLVGGLGFLAQLGPRWWIKVNTGLEMLGLGLVLRI